MEIKPNEIVIEKDYAILIIESQTYGNQGVIIDLDDLERVKQYRWHLSVNSNGTLYVYTKNSFYRGYLHRFITNCPQNMSVDHKNGNTLDNRKNNLRICTQTDNMKNQKIRNDNKSGYRYIHFCKERNVWYVQIKRKRLGTFKTLEEAIKIRNEYLLKYCQEELLLHFDRL